MEKKEKDQILKEAFGALSSRETHTPEKKTAPQPKTEEIEPFALSPLKSALADLSLPAFPSSASPCEKIPPCAPVAANRPSLSQPAHPADPFDLLKHLPKELILPPLPSAAAPQSLASPSLIASLSIPPISRFSPVQLPALKQAPPSFEISYSAPLGELSSFNEPAEPPKAPAVIPFPNLPKLPSLAELETASYSESFDAELVFLPRIEGEEQEGYIFAITLIPRLDLELPKLKHHYTFLLDRSNSIQKDRLSATKNAVAKALGELGPDDTFNIIAFDSKIEKLAPSSLVSTPSSLAAAEDFLEKIQLGSFFSSADLYKALLLTVPGSVQNDELHTAILFTDGENLAKKNAPLSLLSGWTRYNSGKVTLFAIGMENDPHLAKLEAAVAFNKGKLSYSPSKRGLKRKLLKLMKNIQHPIAKNLHCKAISRAPKGQIELFPKPAQMPHLYLGQPYVILGTSDTLDDFILFAQGRLKDRWINIKKTVSFFNAKKGGHSLRQEWALQKAYSLYERYLQEGNPGLLAEANQLLEPFGQPNFFN